jgi:hypothetical protein
LAAQCQLKVLMTGPPLRMRSIERMDSLATLARNRRDESRRAPAIGR